MIYLSIFLGVFCVGLLIRNTKLDGQLLLKDQTIVSMQKDLKIITSEQLDIMALNKMCIEKWEKSVLDNTNLNQSNYQLIQHVQELQKKLS